MMKCQQFFAVRQKRYALEIQIGEHENENSKFKRVKSVNKSTSKGVYISEFDRCVRDIKRTPIMKEQTKFRSTDVPKNFKILMG